MRAGCAEGWRDHGPKGLRAQTGQPPLAAQGGPPAWGSALLACPDNTMPASADAGAARRRTPATNRPNWAASPGDPAPAAYASGPARDRRLNPHDYPSLSAAAAARHHAKQPVPSVPESQVLATPRCASGTARCSAPAPPVTPVQRQGAATWDEDERRPPSVLGVRPAPVEWCAPARRRCACTAPSRPPVVACFMLTAAARRQGR